MHRYEWPGSRPYPCHAILVLILFCFSTHDLPTNIHTVQGHDVHTNLLQICSSVMGLGLLLGSANANANANADADANQCQRQRQ